MHGWGMNKGDILKKTYFLKDKYNLFMTISKIAKIIIGKNKLYFLQKMNINDNE